MDSFCKLNIWDFANKKANFHTHTTRCGHAVGTDREYVERAIEAGYQVLGFSDHGPMLRSDGYVSTIRMTPEELAGYVSSIEALRREYRDDISLYIGLEMEYMPGCFEKTLDFYRQYPIDYLILGQHFLGDEGADPYVARPASDPKYVDRYVRLVTEALDTDLFLYAAHLDLFCFGGDMDAYWTGMKKILNKLKEKNLPVEINGNGLQGNRHYPNPQLAKLASENGNTFIIGIDAHAPRQLSDSHLLESCMQFVKDAGGKLICQ